tara:strand:- start:7320 stop:8741 length:1422 start_codon:yes stop_codon:yes gene_type:complete
MIILIPLEIGVREIESKTLLSFILAKQCKAKIYLFNKRSLFKKIKYFKDCIFLDKSLSVTKIKFHHYIAKNNFLLSIDEEGPLYNWDKFTFKARNPEEIYKKLSINFLQSYYEKNFFKKKFHKKLFVVGHPKYDLLKKPFSDIFINKDQKFKKKFGKYIFFSSSFNFDVIGGYDKYILFTKKIYLDKKKNSYLFKKFLYYQKNDYKNYLLFLSTAKFIAEKFPEKKIILRPHPSQDIKLVNKRFKNKPKNLLIIHEKSSISWIRQCDFYVHSHCSTSIDAALMNKKILRIINNDKIEQENNPINKNLGYTFKNEMTISKFIEDICNDKKNYIFRHNKISENYIYNSSNKLSSLKIANFINKKFKNKNSNLQLFKNQRDIEKTLLSDFLDFIKRKIKKLISYYYVYVFLDFFIDMPPNILLSKEYKDSKMKKSHLLEVPKIINRLNKIVFKKGIKSIIKIKKINNEIFEISKNK